MKNLFYSLSFTLFSASNIAATNVTQFIDNYGDTLVSTSSAQAYNWDSIDIPSSNIQLKNDSQVEVQKAGIYQVSYSLSWRTNGPTGANARRQIKTSIRKNGELFDLAQSHGYARIENLAENATNSATFYIELLAGDYIELYHINASTLNGDAITNPGQSWFSIELVEEIDTIAEQLSQGLVLWLPFNGNTQDESGTGNHGTANGAQLTTDRFGNPDSAYVMDGIDDYISVNNHPTLNPASAITLSAWYKIDQSQTQGFFAGAAGIIQKSFTSETSPWYQYQMCVTSHSWPNSPGSFCAQQYTSGSGLSGVSAISYVPIDSWSHVVTVYDGALIKIFVDGVLVNSSTASGVYTDYGMDVWIGRGPTYRTTGYTPGHFDDIRIYDRALTNTQVKNLYDMESVNN